MLTPVIQSWARQAVLRVAEELRRAFDARLCVANAFPDPDDYEVVSSVKVEPGVFFGAENIEALHRRAVDELMPECGIARSQAIFATWRTRPRHRRARARA